MRHRDREGAHRRVRAPRPGGRGRASTKLLKEPGELTERVAELQAEVAGIAGDVGGDPATTDFKTAVRASPGGPAASRRGLVGLRPCARLRRLPVPRAADLAAGPGCPVEAHGRAGRAHVPIGARERPVQAPSRTTSSDGIIEEYVRKCLPRHQHDDDRGARRTTRRRRREDHRWDGTCDRHDRDDDHGTGTVTTTTETNARPIRPRPTTKTGTAIRRDRDRDRTARGTATGAGAGNRESRPITGLQLESFKHRWRPAEWPGNRGPRAGHGRNLAADTRGAEISAARSADGSVPSSRRRTARDRRRRHDGPRSSFPRRGAPR